ncbi:MAG: hypothetical protein AB7O67_19050 [Vicinamibacterales bacterium]
MGALVTASVGRERRRQPRIAAAQTRWGPMAVLRPGRSVELVDLSAAGARVRGAARLLPGRRAELQLLGPRGRCTLVAAVVYCAVTGLEPLEYSGGLCFDAADPTLLDPG